jgi:formylmethanofuran dehydrogenase subunit E
MSKTINAKDQVLQLLTDIQKLKDQYPFLKMDIDVTARERVVMNEEVTDKYITIEEYKKRAKETTTCENCGVQVDYNEVCVWDGKNLCFNCKTDESCVDW